MARQLRTTDLRVMETPVAVYPGLSLPKQSAPPPEEAGSSVGTTAEFSLGQVDAVLSLCRANKLNYRATVKQIETIVREYGTKNK